MALTIKLTPHVNDENLIRLDIDQEMSDVGAARTFGPTTTRRTAQTTAFAQDQQTIAIGGLMRDKASESVKKVPLLGFPLVGFFFRSLAAKAPPAPRPQTAESADVGIDLPGS